MEPTRVLFYRPTGQYACFSNFFASPVILRSKTWPTTEHFFQAMKFEGTDYAETIRNAKTPAMAFKLGRSRSQSHPCRADWNAVKYAVMKEAVREKFTQHSALREVLLGTQDAEIVEHTARDKCWADGGNGSGQNLLGKLLMEVRAELRKIDEP